MSFETGDTMKCVCVWGGRGKIELQREYLYIKEEKISHGNQHKWVDFAPSLPLG